MIKMILLIIYLALILGVIFLEHKNPSEAILWVVVLICVPYLGAILYIIFGSTINMKITRAFRKNKLMKIADMNYLNMTDMYPPLEEIHTGYLSESDISVIKFNYFYNDSPFTCYDEVKFFINGKNHYESLFKDIYNAETSIHIEFYTIHNDEVGNELIKALTKKAKEGLEIQVMCDYIANISSPPKMFKDFREAGGKLKRIKPYVTHFRGHRKIVVIDGKIGYIGGMNIGKQYANGGKKKNPWRDTQIRLLGPCVTILDHLFLLDWVCNLSQREFKAFKYDLNLTKLEEKYTIDKPMQFVVGGVDNDKESIKMCYLSMIRNAKSTIRIQSPYFVPDVSILDELRAAQASGIKIELMIPGIKASFFLDPVTTYYCGKLMEYGARVYKYTGYIHAKTMIIDEDLCCVGSVNMDIRSLQVDDEICGIFYNDSVAKEYSKIYTEDIKNCKEYTIEEFNKRGLFDKIKEDIFLLFAPLM